MHQGIKVVVINANGSTYSATLPVAALEAMQGIVGGYIENFGLVDCNLICNEDGISLKLPANKVAGKLAFAMRGIQMSFFGNVIICGPVTESHWQDIGHEAAERAILAGYIG